MTLPVDPSEGVPAQPVGPVDPLEEVARLLGEVAPPKPPREVPPPEQPVPTPALPDGELADLEIPSGPPLTRSRPRGRRAIGPGILAALAVLLLVAGAVGLYFVIDAYHQEELARDRLLREQLDQERRQAEEAAAALERQKQEQANERRMQATVRQLLGTLASTTRPQLQKRSPLNAAETEALWELATSQEGLHERFTEEAWPRPPWAKPLLARADYALQAALGLDEQHRGRVARTLAERLQDPNLGTDHKLSLALALVHADVLDRPLAEQVAPILAQAMTRTTEPAALTVLAQELSAVVGRLPQGDAVSFCSQATSTLVPVLLRSTDPRTSVPLVEGLAALSARMEPTVAVLSLSTTLHQTNEPEAVRLLAVHLSRAARRLPPGELVSTLQKAVSQARKTVLCRALAVTLADVASQLEPQEAARLAGMSAWPFIREMAAIRSADNLRSLAEGFVALAVYLDPREARDFLRLALRGTTDPGTQQILTRGLLGLPQPPASRESADAALKVLETLVNPDWTRTLARQLAGVSTRLNPTEAEPICGRAADMLIQFLREPGNQDRERPLADGVIALVARLDPLKARAYLERAIPLASEASAKRALREANARHMARLEPRLAGDLLLAALTRSDLEAAPDLAPALSVTITRLESRPAAILLEQTGRFLSRDLGKNPDTVLFQAEGLAALTEHLSAQEAAAICGPAVEDLTRCMDDTRPTETLRAHARALATLLARLERKQATTLCAPAGKALGEALEKADTPSARHELTLGLLSLAEWLKADDVIPPLLETLKRTTRPVALAEMAPGLCRLADRLEPDQAAPVRSRALQALTQALTKTTSPAELATLVRGLSAVTAPRDSREAGPPCVLAAIALLRRHSQATSPAEARSMADLLSAVLARENPDAEREYPGRVAGVVAGLAGQGQPLLAPVWLSGALEPVASPLPAPLLVELLKHPLCIREARRCVLDQLKRHYQRPFADQWEFVGFAREQGLPLDLTSPPRRVP